MKSPVNVDIGIGAKAEIRAEIPTSSAGRFLDALTDIIRPFSEKRGLRADQIRLQREDVLLEIGRKARKRLLEEGVQPQPLSNKFLVPFLEAASLENMEEQKLTDMWANLLANTSTSGSIENIAFINILKQLTSEEAQLFEYVFTRYASKRKKTYCHWHYEDAPYSIKAAYIYIFARDNLLGIDPGKWPKKILDYWECPGVHIRSIEVIGGKYRDYPYEELANFYQRDRPVRQFKELSFELLVQLGLLNKVDLEELVVDDKHMLDLRAYVATELGVRFFEAVASPEIIKDAINRIPKKSSKVR